MNQQQLLQFTTICIVVILVILAGILTLNKVGSITEYCLEHPNTTHYEIESGEIINCSDYLPTGETYNMGELVEKRW